MCAARACRPAGRTVARCPTNRPAHLAEQLLQAAVGHAHRLELLALAHVVGQHPAPEALQARTGMGAAAASGGAGVMRCHNAKMPSKLHVRGGCGADWCLTATALGPCTAGHVGGHAYYTSPSCRPVTHLQQLAELHANLAGADHANRLAAHLWSIRRQKRGCFGWGGKLVKAVSAALRHPLPLLLIPWPPRPPEWPATHQIPPGPTGHNCQKRRAGG